MNFTRNLLLFFVIIGGINIVILLLIKSKTKKNNDKIKGKEIKHKKSSGIRALNCDDDELICMVDNNLELQYGYEFSDKEVFEDMIEPHRNIYILIWFDREVVSGGLGEYFFGVSNITKGYIEEALEDVGALNTLDRYKDFLLENNVEEELKNINKRSVEEYSNFMSKFDFSQFNDFYNHDSIEKLMASYIRKNICEFSDLSDEELKILDEINREVEVEQN
ncbi:MAG: hypothetical protein RSD36_03705 [Terrisporobacter sp.]